MNLTETLIKGDHSLVLLKSGVLHTYDGGGVRDLYNLYTLTPELLGGASIADKVIGVGAAALMVIGKVRDVHAIVISEKALRLLFCGGVAVTYDRLVPGIINRSGTGPCPLESRLKGYQTAITMWPEIDKFVKELSNTSR